jgi:VRR-NUC domain
MSADPPLLMLAEGRRPRARREAVPRPKEISLHMPVADLLRQLARPDWRWSHYPSGEHRDVRTAAKLKKMGVQRGWPDFILFDPNGLLYALELKRAGGRLSADQEAFRTWCIERAVNHAVVCTVAEAIKILSAWGVIRARIGGLR